MVITALSRRRTKAVEPVVRGSVQFPFCDNTIASAAQRELLRHPLRLPLPDPDPDIGRRVTPRRVREVLERLKPDYVQIDCKGHPGVTSYPSRFGTAAASFARDPLRIWRRETARAGVALYMHYSGVWDTAAVKAHPAWAAVDAAGKRSDRITSVFGPYVDKLMIPQLLELAREYGVDGVWVDGDCWATVRDYSPRARAAWRRETGRSRTTASTRHASKGASWPASAARGT